MFVIGKILKKVELKKYILHISILGYIIYLTLWIIFNFKTRINYSTPGIWGIILL